MSKKRKAIKSTVAKKLWVKSGGRCEYEGCNKLLYRDSLTEQEMNTSYIAHIVSVSSTGPRGDAIRSKQLEEELSNLMLLCDVCHRRIDKERVAEHPEGRLLKMKMDHEDRIELVTTIAPEKKSHIIIYTAKVGTHEVNVSYQQAAYAMIPERFPASHRSFKLGVANSMDNDFSNTYWTFQLRELENSFRTSIQPLLGSDEVQDFSVFAFAPQPLLIRLGTLLSDKYPGQVYQRHRKEHPWKWEEESKTKEFKLIEPEHTQGTPALAFSLSASIDRRDIHAVIGTDCSIWEITIDSPFNSFLCSKDLLQKFKQCTTIIVSKIKQKQGYVPLHIFPAMPVSAAVEFGKLRMPKSDMPWITYDYNNQIPGFSKAITIH